MSDQCNNQEKAVDFSDFTKDLRNLVSSMRNMDTGYEDRLFRDLNKIKND